MKCVGSLTSPRIARVQPNQDLPGVARAWWTTYVEFWFGLAMTEVGGVSIESSSLSENQFSPVSRNGAPESDSFKQAWPADNFRFSLVF